MTAILNYKPTNEPLSDGRWKLAWDSFHFGLYCQNRGVDAYTKVCLPIYNLYDMHMQLYHKFLATIILTNKLVILTILLRVHNYGI